MFLRTFTKLPVFSKVLKKPYLAFSTSQTNLIKQLRNETQSSISDCKKALDSSNNDLEKAREFLYKKGLASAEKRQSHVATDGAIGLVFSPDRSYYCIAEVNLNFNTKANCQTDFVAKTELFLSFVNGLLETVSNKNLILDLKNENEIDQFLKEHKLINSIFPSYENISIKETNQLVITPNIGRSACLTEVDFENNSNEKRIQEISDNLAMVLLGTKPNYINRGEVPEDILNIEKEKIKIEMAKAIKNKDEKIVQKMIEGKLKKFYQDNVFMDMDYFLDTENEKTVRIN